MSELASKPAPEKAGVFRGIRRRVQDGTLPWWRALGVAGFLLLTSLLVAALFALLCYSASLVTIGIARGRAGRDFRGGDPDVIAVAVSLGVATVVVATVGTVWHRRLVARRRAQMQSWADAHGWAYEPSSILLSSRWSAPGIHQGAHVTDVLTRSTAHGEVTSMTLGPGAGEAGARRHAVMMVGSRWFPTLSLTLKTSLDRAEQVFGGQQITVESYDVNERWRMRCADERFAHEVLHPRLLERLDSTTVPGLCLLVQGSDVVAHAPGPTALDSIEPMTDLVLDLVSLLPTYLSDDYPPLAPDVPRRERRRRLPRRAR